jgi:NO-binding membrane sensor protein with MHYT domain
MENVFPDVLFLSFFAPIAIRLALAFVLLFDARTLWNSGQNNRVYAVGSVVLGLAIGAGFLTQVAVIIAAGYIIYHSMSSSPSVFNNTLLSFLSLAILVSLFLTGSGPFAFDLPY